MTALDRISVEPSRRCSKGCSFCYNGSAPDGDGAWTTDAIVALALDCAASGVRSISFGGGEPLEWPGIFSALGALEGRIARSLTSNGLPLRDRGTFEALVAARPEKVHVSIHTPGQPSEVERVTDTVLALGRAGLRSGVNLVVRRSRLAAAHAAVVHLRGAGIGMDRIVLLPMRGDDTPSPTEVAFVAGGPRFQSMSCLRACGKSERFASIDADRRAAWCSYTRTRRSLTAPSYVALVAALDGLGLAPCAEGALVRLGPRRGPDLERPLDAP